ncbi:MAG: CvpA family protein [Planctomycetota bacterium]
MILNIVVILFILFMIYWWGAQGLFSAFLHLTITIVAGAVALSLWEPIAVPLLGTPLGTLAWGLALVAPFALLLIVLRVLSDKLIPGNVQYQPILSNVLGGACGFAAAVLTAGLMVIGLGFMPMGPFLFGVQPYALTTDNNQLLVSDSGDGMSSLWVPVDSWTEQFYDFASRGSFGTGTPLARYQPDLAQQAHLSRLTVDEKVSNVVAPSTVEITNVFVHPTVVPGLDDDITANFPAEYNQADHKVLVIETTWENRADAPTTYDRDSTARIFWNQVRLVTDAYETGDTPAVYGPIAITQEDVVSNSRVFRPWNQTATFAFSTRTEPLIFTFLLPEDADPSYLLLRNTRYEVADLVPRSEPVAMLITDALGAPDEAARAAAAEAAEEQTNFPSGQPIELTDSLPWSFSANSVTGIEHNNQGAINGGRATVQGGGAGAGGQRTTLRRMYAPQHQRMVRLAVRTRTAQSFLGNAIAAAERLSPIWIEDANGNRTQPLAFAIDKGRGDGGMVVYYGEPMRSAQQIPTHEMTGNNILYLYFLVTPGVTIESYHLGNNHSESVELAIPR